MGKPPSRSGESSLRSLTIHEFWGGKKVIDTTLLLDILSGLPSLTHFAL
jgi:hypothetical protein